MTPRSLPVLSPSDCQRSTLWSLPMVIAMELAEGLGIRVRQVDDLQEEALWLEECRLLLIDRSTSRDRALVHLGDVVSGRF